MEVHLINKQFTETNIQLAFNSVVFIGISILFFVSGDIALQILGFLLIVSLLYMYYSSKEIRYCLGEIKVYRRFPNKHLETIKVNEIRSISIGHNNARFGNHLTLHLVQLASSKRKLIFRPKEFEYAESILKRIGYQGHIINSF